MKKRGLLSWVLEFVGRKPETLVSEEEKNE